MPGALSKGLVDTDRTAMNDSHFSCKGSRRPRNPVFMELLGRRAFAFLLFVVYVSAVFEDEVGVHDW